MGQTMTRLVTTTVRDHDDVRAFFDRSASSYEEQHGPAERLLRYRMSLLRQSARFRSGDTVLEIGCGDGMHLFALADSFARGIGIDISEEMVSRANARGSGDKLRFAASLGEELSTVDDASVDVAYCVGSLEHMLDQPAVARAAFRVLRQGGRFVGLTPNGGYIWYRRLAPLLGLPTQHLATDHFLTGDELATLLREAGFADIRIDSWTFIPRGDMPTWVAALLSVLDAVGRVFNAGRLRGGLRFEATQASRGVAVRSA
jgi:2-polyprenyl-6-hydroxyphenyl methylase/3-demethylubiquinone-9 3-methyltransferase